MNSYYIDRYIKSGYELNGRVEDSWKKDISFIEILVIVWERIVGGDMEIIVIYLQASQTSGLA